MLWMWNCENLYMHSLLSFVWEKHSTCRFNILKTRLILLIFPRVIKLKLTSQHGKKLKSETWMLASYAVEPSQDANFVKTASFLENWLAYCTCTLSFYCLLVNHIDLKDFQLLASLFPLWYRELISIYLLSSTSNENFCSAGLFVRFKT